MKRLILILSILSMGVVTADRTNQLIAATATQKNPQKSSRSTASLKVRGNCDMCKSRIEKASLSIVGVSSATWNREQQQLNLIFNPQITSLSMISIAIANIGHDTEKNRAKDGIYSKLPDCCHYRQ